MHASTHYSCLVPQLGAELGALRHRLTTAGATGRCLGMTAAGAEFGRRRYRRSAFGAERPAGCLCCAARRGRRAASAGLRLLHGTRDHPRHHGSESGSESEAHSGARRAAAFAAGTALGRILDRLCRLELHIGVHIADRAHRGPLVHLFLHLVGRRHRVDVEVGEIDPVLWRSPRSPSPWPPYPARRSTSAGRRSF